MGCFAVGGLNQDRSVTDVLGLNPQGRVERICPSLIPTPEQISPFKPSAFATAGTSDGEPSSTLNGGCPSMTVSFKKEPHMSRRNGIAVALWALVVIFVGLGAFLYVQSFQAAPAPAVEGREEPNEQPAGPADPPALPGDQRDR